MSTFNIKSIGHQKHWTSNALALDQKSIIPRSKGPVFCFLRSRVKQQLLAKEALDNATARKILWRTAIQIAA
jgi:hypothetical protein